MEAARKIEDDPYGPGGRLAYLSRADRLLPASEVHDLGLISELPLGADPRPVVDPPPIDTLLTDVTGVIDFDKAGSVQIEPTDSPERIIRLLRETGGVYTDEGEFSTGAYQLDVLRLALEGNEAALEELPEDSGLWGWAVANLDSEEAAGVFEQLYCIMHTKESRPGGEPPAEAISHLLEPEPAPVPASAPSPVPDPRLSKRVLRRLRPRLT